ncbi:hypothetical protein PAXRUDRAFT_409425 [Paxillus rubicundulus Ve08.2h10]|uniref:Uncharacterized protein n=1 Tax=Paxillus rubicundulus Ve08.2h10 TaxID=930991 RepID=A0A0D0E2V8_9AGAM|nr:hypothetical protein PAXRUDRAFT_409425 [Paxillus rubicundulus Ve08.2h10]
MSHCWNNLAGPHAHRCTFRGHPLRPLLTSSQCANHRSCTRSDICAVSGIGSHTMDYGLAVGAESRWLSQPTYRQHEEHFERDLSLGTRLLGLARPMDVKYNNVMVTLLDRLSGFEALPSLDWCKTLTNRGGVRGGSHEYPK